MLQLIRGLLLAVVAAAVLLAVATVALRTSLPRTEGTVVVRRLGATAEIIRDAHGVPHIHADSREDAFFALGFAHAQDRLWQMEFQRRLGAGRLAEVLGEEALPTDRFMRTLGVQRVAEATTERLDARTRGILEAYADGVNAFLEQRRGLLPPEFLLLGFEPEPWRPADTVAWSKMMAYDLSRNWTDELLRARLARVLHPDRVAELWPAYPEDAPVTLPDYAALYERLPLEETWRAAVQPLSAEAGSNAWALSGDRTRSGAPLLANDPHLGLQLPSLWYLAHLRAPGLDVIGATLPGTPTVLLGRNEHLAWGFTNTGSDVQDLFIEQVSAEDPDRYRTPDGFEPFVVRTETIRVRGGADETLTVRETRHGPVISDLGGTAEAVAAGAGAGGTELVLALAWTALRPDDLTVQAALALPFATGWEEFTRALESFHSPPQNVVYADAGGRIGFYAAGRVPIRAAGQGLAPVPGWNGRYDWVGFVPFSELPHALEPASGEIVSANQKLVPDGYPHHLTSDWAPPYRAERIEQLLAMTERHTAEGQQRIQADLLSLAARALLPAALAADTETALARRAQALLLGWDGVMDRDAAAPLIYAAWLRSFTRLVLEDDLGELTAEYAGHRPLFLLRAPAGEGEWCSDRRGGGCAELSARALREAVAWLAERHGDDPTAWRWGDEHRAALAHPVLGRTPLAWALEPRPRTGGGPFTVAAARYDPADAERPFAQTEGAGFRMVVDLGDPSASRFVIAGGQSGNPLSPWYRSLLGHWQRGEGIPMATDPAHYGPGAVTLRLEPRP